jgi:hypothetical protein
MRCRYVQQEMQQSFEDAMTEITLSLHKAQKRKEFSLHRMALVVGVVTNNRLVYF